VFQGFKDLRSLSLYLSMFFFHISLIFHFNCFGRASLFCFDLDLVILLLLFWNTPQHLNFLGSLAFSQPLFGSNL